MNKSVAEKWVKALRSGEYKQGTQTLERDGAYCCLGVLCKLAEKEDVGIFYYEDNILRGDNLCSQVRVRDWAGMNSFEGTYGNVSLAHDNDEGKSFSEIADIIEKNVEAL